MTPVIEQTIQESSAIPAAIPSIPDVIPAPTEEAASTTPAAAPLTEEEVQAQRDMAFKITYFFMAFTAFTFFLLYVYYKLDQKEQLEE